MGCDVACVNHDGGGQEGVSNHNSLVIGPLGRVSCERVRIAGSGDCECRTKGGVLGGDRLLPSKNIAERVVRVCSGAQMAVSGTSTGESRRVRPGPGGLLVPRRKVDCKLGFGPGIPRSQRLSVQDKAESSAVRDVTGHNLSRRSTGIWNCRISSVRRGG